MQKVGELAQAVGLPPKRDKEQGREESSQKALPDAGTEEVNEFGFEVRVVA